MDFWVFAGALIFAFILYLLRVVTKIPMLTVAGSLWVILFCVFFVATGEKLAMRYELVNVAPYNATEPTYQWFAIETDVPLAPLSLIALILVAGGVLILDLWGAVRG